MMAGDLRTGAARICDDMNDFMADLRTPEWHPDHNGEKLYGPAPPRKPFRGHADAAR
jgi:hypothetical protein